MRYHRRVDRVDRVGFATDPAYGATSDRVTADGPRVAEPGPTDTVR